MSAESEKEKRYPRSDWNIKLHNPVTVIGYLLEPFGVGTLCLNASEHGNSTVQMYKKRIDAFRDRGTIMDISPRATYCHRRGHVLAMRDIKAGKV